MTACVTDLVNQDMATQWKHVKLPEDFESVIKLMPEDKRLEVIYARDAEDRQIRGVKQQLPNRNRSRMTEDEFHEFYGHMGCGKNCVICHLVRGSMRFIYKVVDKYIETRTGYMFDMDTLPISHSCLLYTSDAADE